MSKIRGIIFDAGDVLFNARLWRKWLHKFLKEEFNLKLTYSDLFYLWDNYYLRDIHLKRLDYNDGFCKFLNHLGLGQEKIKTINQKSFEKKKEIEENTKPYKWVYNYLPKIKSKGIKIGILTDSENSSIIIKKRYNIWEIDRYIDIIISSADTGIIKPYQEAYLFILKELDLNINATIFIGHDKDEILGAKILGLKTVNYFNKTSFNSLMSELLN